MKKIYIFILGFIFLAGSLFAQTKTVTFVGQDASTKQYIKLSKVVITNRTQNWSETIVYPDTVLILKTTGIADKALNGFALGQNRPNPFQGSTDVTLEVSKSGKITMELFDILGRNLKSLSLDYVQPGQHNFRIQVAQSGIYFLTAIQNGHKTSVKMIAQADATGNHIDYVGMGASFNNNAKGEISNPYANGDELSFQGIANVEGKEIASKTIISSVINTETITLSFEIGSNEFICGTSTLTDINGNSYNTVKIGDQCWMKENLRTTHYSDGTAISQGSSNSTTDGYWYYPNNSDSNKVTYGLLYNWKAVMRNDSSSSSNPSNVQGICPTGWHVPSDAEWTQLTDYVKTQSQYCCDSNTSNIAKSLASTTGWSSSSSTCAVGNSPSSNNATGFSAVPAGIYYDEHLDFGSDTHFWIATEFNSGNACSRYLNNNNAYVNRSLSNKACGYSVRCLMD